jgi:gas vesicle protein
MNDRQQIFEINYEKSGTISTEQPYVRSVGTNIDVGGNREANRPSTTIKSQPQSHVPTAGNDMNSVLSRLLMGGLIGATLGATLGTLASAFAGKRTSEGVNRAAKGVGEAAKTIAQGVTQTAKGVGDAAKSVADGVNYAVVGSLQDTASGVSRAVGAAFEAAKGTAKDTVEGVSNAVEGALDAVKDTAENAKQSAISASDAVKDTAENAKQSAIGAIDAVKDTAESIKPSENQEVKIAQERRVADAPQIDTGEQDKTSMTYISGPEGTIPVDAGMPVTYGEPNYEERKVDESEIYRQTTGI